MSADGAARDLSRPRGARRENPFSGFDRRATKQTAQRSADSGSPVRSPVLVSILHAVSSTPLRAWVRWLPIKLKNGPILFSFGLVFLQRPSINYQRNTINSSFRLKLDQKKTRQFGKETVKFSEQNKLVFSSINRPSAVNSLFIPHSAPGTPHSPLSHGNLHFSPILAAATR